MKIQLERAYADDRSHGTRVLVDRLWPRGVRKDELALDDWCKEVAPSDELRRWFDHDVDRWEEFRERYFAELDDNEPAWKSLLDAALAGELVLVYATKDRDHNNAVVLCDYLFARRLDTVLAAYTDGTCDEDELVGALGTLASDARDASSNIAKQIGELAARVEMITFNVCAAERRGAICEIVHRDRHPINVPGAWKPE